MRHYENLYEALSEITRDLIEMGIEDLFNHTKYQDIVEFTFRTLDWEKDWLKFLEKAMFDPANPKAESLTGTYNFKRGVHRSLVTEEKYLAMTRFAIDAIQLRMGEITLTTFVYEIAEILSSARKLHEKVINIDADGFIFYVRINKLTEDLDFVNFKTDVKY